MEVIYRPACEIRTRQVAQLKLCKSPSFIKMHNWQKFQISSTYKFWDIRGRIRTRKKIGKKIFLAFVCIVFQLGQDDKTKWDDFCTPFWAWNWTSNLMIVKSWSKYLTRNKRNKVTLDMIKNFWYLIFNH